MYVTSGQAVSSSGTGMSTENCNNEKADTRVKVHTLHRLQQGAKSVLVSTVDTDVIVVLVGPFYDLIVTQTLADI